METEYESLRAHFEQEIEVLLEGYLPVSSPLRAPPLTTDLKSHGQPATWHSTSEKLPASGLGSGISLPPVFS